MSLTFAPQPIYQFALVSLLLIAFTGCARAPATKPSLYIDPETQHCETLYTSLDSLLESQITPVTAWARISGFPHLRVNRFLASLRNAPMDRAQQSAWVERLRRLDMKARRIELAGLSPFGRQTLASNLGLSKPLLPTLEACGRRLAKLDSSRAERLALLRQQALVPPDYRLWQRVLGLYPLSQIPVRVGVHLYQRETYSTFAQPLTSLPVEGHLKRFGPTDDNTLASEAVAHILAQASNNPLRIPEPTGQAVDRLFNTFAPVWEIDIGGRYDQIGAPYWLSPSRPVVNVHRPRTYRYLSATHWQGNPLLQLNYVIWFASRPPKGGFDLYAGALDGITWRVTLAADGMPLIYDAMHNCGCYHMFFPTDRLQLKTQTEYLSEPPLVPQVGPNPDLGERLVIRIASRSHYLQRLYTKANLHYDRTYELVNYKELYQVNTPRGGKRGMFGADAIVPGTQRAERWVLWPMGIPTPGAMRERGHHATAFIGRRHFDDPDLFQNLFILKSLRQRSP